MAGIVNIDFRIGGEDAVLRAIKTITQASQAAAREQVRSERQAAAASSRATSQRAQNNNADWKSAQANIRRRQEALGASMTKDIEDTRKATRKRQEVLGAAMARDVEDTRKAERRKEEIRGAAMARDVQRTQQMARRRQEALGSAIDKDVRATERAEARKARVARREEDRAARKASGATRGFFTDTGDGLTRGFNRGVGVIASGAGLITGALGVGGIQSAVQSRMGLEAAAAQLAADVRSGNDKFIDQKALITESQQTARTTGINAEEVMSALGIASSQGGGLEGLQAFRGKLAGWGELALASGTSITDLASVSATMSNNDIRDPAQQLAIARSINAAAKTGNVGFREMASNVMEVAGMHQAMGFAGGSERRMGLASGLIQMAKQGGAASAAEASTSANSFMADLVGDKAKKLLTSKHIKTYTTDANGKKVARDAEDLTVDILKASKGDPEVLSKIFDIRSKKTQSAISSAWNKNGEAGVRALFKEFTTATQTEKQVKEEADLQKGTSANQIARAMEDFKAKVGNQLIPTLTKLIPTFSELAGVVADLVKAFAESPKEMIAKFVALSTLLGGAQAALGNVVGRIGSTLLDKLMGTRVMTMNVQAAAVNMAGGVGSVGSALGGPLAGGGKIGLNPATAVGVLAAGMAGYGVGTEVAGGIDKTLAGSDTRGAALEGYSLAGAIRSGKGTAADRDRATAVLAKLRAEQEKGIGSRVWENATAGVRGLAGGDVSIANVASLHPVVAAARGLIGGGLSQQQANNDSTSRDAIVELQSALAKATKGEELIAATQANTAAIQALPQAIAGAVNLQGPKVQP